MDGDNSVYEGLFAPKARARDANYLGLEFELLFRLSQDKDISSEQHNLRP